jgi:hypothetical protein
VNDLSLRCCEMVWTDLNTCKCHSDNSNVALKLTVQTALTEVIARIRLINSVVLVADLYRIEE